MASFSATCLEDRVSWQGFFRRPYGMQDANEEGEVLYKDIPNLEKYSGNPGLDNYEELVQTPAGNLIFIISTPYSSGALDESMNGVYRE